MSRRNGRVSTPPEAGILLSYLIITTLISFTVYLASYLFGEGDGSTDYGASAYGASSGSGAGYAAPSTGYAASPVANSGYAAAPAVNYAQPAVQQQGYAAPAQGYASPQYAGYASRKGLDSSMNFVEKSISKFADWLHDV